MIADGAQHNKYMNKMASISHLTVFTVTLVYLMSGDICSAAPFAQDLTEDTGLANYGFGKPISSESVGISQDAEATMITQAALKGGSLKVNQSGIGHLTLHGIDETSLEFFHDSSNTEPQQFIMGTSSEFMSKPRFQRRFAVLFVGANLGDSALNMSAANFVNTSVISMELLDLVVGENDDDSVQYVVKLSGDIALRANADGTVSHGIMRDYRREERTFVLGESTLLVDLVEGKQKDSSSGLTTLTAEQEQRSLMHQTKSGALGKAYEKQVRSLKGDQVSAQGIITGPLMLICCPFAFLELPFPPLWGFVVVKLICCII